MRHATQAALDDLEPLLVRLRDVEWLTEKGRGVFYRGSRAFLHFHEDPTGLHADVRLAADFERVRVHTQVEREALLERILTARTNAPGTRPSGSPRVGGGRPC